MKKLRPISILGGGCKICAHEREQVPEIKARRSARMAVYHQRPERQLAEKVRRDNNKDFCPLCGGGKKLSSKHCRKCNGSRMTQFCKNGHERTPENVNAQGRCKICKKACSQTEESKAYRKAYRQSAQVKIKAYEYDYARSEKGKAVQKAYRQSPQGRLAVKAKEDRRKGCPKRKIYTKVYNNSEKRKTYTQSESHLKQLRDSSKRRVKDVTDDYIAALLKCKRINMPPELIEIKRLTIQLQRSIKCQSKAKQSLHQQAK